MRFSTENPRPFFTDESHERDSQSGVLVVIAGPTAAGKSSVLEGLVKSNPGMHRVVSYTTRPRREHEADGRDYHFVNQEAFEADLAAGKFLEHDQYNGKYYGTMTRDIAALLEGRDVAWILTMGHALNIDDYVRDTFDSATAQRFIDQKVTMLVRTSTWEQLAEHFVTTRGGTVEEFEVRIKPDRDFLEANEGRFEHILYNETGELSQTILQANAIVNQKRHLLR